MNSRCTKRKSVADDGVPDKAASEQTEGSPQKPGFQRPGPACSKRRTLEASVKSQPALPSLRSRASSSLGSPSPVQPKVESHPASPSQNSQNESQSASAEENLSSQPVLTPSIADQTSASTSSQPRVPDAVTDKQEQPPEGSSCKSQLGLDDDYQFIMLVRKFPILYSTKDRSTRGKVKKLESWKAISNEIGNNTSVVDCKDKWRSLREKYCRVKKQIVDGGHVNDKTMQFINNLNFLDYQRRAGIKHKKPTITSEKQKQLRSRSRSNIKETPSEIQHNGPKPDQPFADDIAAALQRFSPEQKYVLKAKFWQVLAEFGTRP